MPARTSPEPSGTGTILLSTQLHTHPSTLSNLRWGIFVWSNFISWFLLALVHTALELNFLLSWDNVCAQRCASIFNHLKAALLQKKKKKKYVQTLQNSWRNQKDPLSVREDQSSLLFTTVTSQILVLIIYISSTSFDWEDQIFFPFVDRYKNIKLNPPKKTIKTPFPSSENKLHS